MQHQLAWLSERFDEQPRGNIGDDYDRNDPAKNEPKNSWKNRVRIARDIKKIKIAVDKSLGSDDPETDRRQAEHDGVMHGDAEYQGDEIKQDRYRVWNDAKPR